MDRLRDMEIFVRVAETCSLSDAARHLGLGQPAVSKAIARLEAKLRTALVIRTAQGAKPTDAGRAFLDHARTAIAAADHAEQQARRLGAGIGGRLRVCAATTFARMHVVPLIPAFLADHPDLEIDVVLDDRAIDLVEEGIDVALRMGDLPESSIVARRIAVGRRSVVATPAYLARQGEPASPRDLEEHEAVVYQPAGATWTFLGDRLSTTVTLRGRMRVSAAEGVRAAVLTGFGLTVASDWMFADELASGDVIRLLPTYALPNIDLWAMFPAGRLTPARTRAFVDFVEASLERERPISSAPARSMSAAT